MRDFRQDIVRICFVIDLGAQGGQFSAKGKLYSAQIAWIRNFQNLRGLGLRVWRVRF